MRIRSRRSKRAGRTKADAISREELQLATRNHGMPLEALHHDITPAGLHYLLIHYDIPVIDASAWRLTIDGLVDRPLSVSLDELRSHPAHTVTVTMECAGNGRARLTPRPVSQPWLLEAVGTAEWTGVPLRTLLDDAGLGGDAVEIVFTGHDRGVEGGVEQDYARSLRVEDAMGDDVVLAYEMNGGPLPPQHGFPLRLVVPGWYGMTSVKWLARITAVSEAFHGYQQERGYRFRRDDADPGRPVTRMAPRSLMVPPGIPDFMTRRRTLPLGRCEFVGRAWSGWGPVTRVEVSTDGGQTWHDAQVGPSAGAAAWHSWRYQWEPEGPGEYELCCRARDAAGNQQPTTPSWNVGGYANNEVQRVPVTVVAAE